jgi:hypothetical protein
MKSEFKNSYGQFDADSDNMNEPFQRFELLSAYMDGEITPHERQQVQEWLDTDPQLKQTYLGLLRLQREMPCVPTPSTGITPEQLSERVFQRIEQANRLNRLLFWGGMVVTAVLVGALSNLFIGGQYPSPPPLQQANLELESEPLTITLNQPLIDLPGNVQ